VESVENVVTATGEGDSEMSSDTTQSIAQALDEAFAQSAAVEKLAWNLKAGDLAQWTLDHLVNRTDAWGINKPDGSRSTWKGPLDLHLLKNHFQGKHLIGIHLISLHNTCKTIKIDIDAHGEGDTQAVAAKNMAIALELGRRAHEIGLNPILSDSNGKGGLHFENIFVPPITSKEANYFGLWLARGFNPNKRGGIEVFPKRADRNTEKGYGGGWVRLYGRHHKLPHWTKIWSWTEERWLEDQEAVTALLAHYGDDPAILATVDYMPPPAPPKLPKIQTTRTSTTGSDATARATSYAKATPGAVSGSGGHNRTLFLAMKLVEYFGLSVSAATPIMQSWNKTCDPPWSEAELQHKLQSADARAENRGYMLNQEFNSGEDADISGIINQSVVKTTNGVNITRLVLQEATR